MPKTDDKANYTPGIEGVDFTVIEEVTPDGDDSANS